MKINIDELTKEVGKYLTNISLIIFTVVIAGGVFDRIGGGLGIAIALGAMLVSCAVGIILICNVNKKGGRND